ncbi:MAG: sulfite exporter TauE/SafE family protein [Firmicutes bacterium]|nr:sulfite exporter TauE/SafE family protein [Bacillota bacterium]
MTYIQIFLIFLLSGITQGALGFGFAIISVPLLTLILPIKIAAVVVLLLGFITNLQLVIRLRKHVDLKIVSTPVVFSIIGRLTGTYILINSAGDVLRVILGIFLVLLSIYFFRYSTKIKIHASFLNGSIAGSLSGLFGGMFNISGPPIVIYYISSINDKMKYAACMQITMTTSSVFSILIHILYGNIDWNVLTYVGTGLAAAIAGSLLGLYIFTKINKENLNKIIYIFLMLMGVILVIR